MMWHRNGQGPGSRVPRRGLREPRLALRWIAESLAVATLLAMATHATAAPRVYYSPYDDGASSCGGMDPCPFADEVHIWVEADPTSPAPFCSDVCAVNALIEVEGGSFETIDLESGITQNPTCSAGGSPCPLPANTTRVQLIATFASQTLQAGPRRLASIGVVTQPLGTSIAINGIEIIDAQMQQHALPVRIFALPEPGTAPALVAGLALLLTLRGRGLGRFPRAR